MGEDFQAEVCGSSCWSSPRSSIGLSPCLMSINDYGSFRWPSHDLISNQGSILFDQFMQKPSEGFLIDSSPQIMDISRSVTSTTTTAKDWSQNLISVSGSGDTIYQSTMVQENMSPSRLNYRQDSPNNQIRKQWSSKNLSLEGGQDSIVDEPKQTSTTEEFSLSCSIPMSSSSYSYPSTLIDNLFSDDPQQLENQTMYFPSTKNYQTDLNEFSLFSSIRPSLSQQQEINPLDLTKNIPSLHASAEASSSISTHILPLAQDKLVGKSISKKLKPKSGNGVVHDSKKSAEPSLKRPRIETPSMLPTFKVRKEKLGDRITALQQLVSPFGKTDTASVLQEAIEYIKFLHGQVNLLTTPYMESEAPIQQQQKYDSLKHPEEIETDLRGRGLCLVPISSTFPVANETTVDFWTPTF